MSYNIPKVMNGYEDNYVNVRITVQDVKPDVHKAHLEK